LSGGQRPRETKSTDLPDQNRTRAESLETLTDNPRRR